jgi:hypothetical protein
MTNWGTVLIAFLSFILGLISNLFVQWWSDRKRLQRVKGALELHLKDIILKECTTLRSEFERIIHEIQNFNRYSLSFKSCKTFDAEIYKANNPSDYYKIYGSTNKKFDKLVSIYSIISYLTQNIPSKVYSDYMREVDESLTTDSIINTGKSMNQMFKESPFFEGIRIRYIDQCQNMISEIDLLTKLIKELI